VEGAGGQWSLLTQEDPGGRPRSAGLRTAWKSRRTGSAAEAPDQLMFTVNQRAAIRLHARLRAPWTRDRRYAAGPARSDRLPLGADRKLLRIDRGSNFVLSHASRCDLVLSATHRRWCPQARQQSRCGCSAYLRGGAPGRLEPSARSDSGQSRGGFSEQTHGRAGYLAVVGGCGNCCRGRPDDSDHGGPAVRLDYLDRQCVGTVDGAGGQDG
jgi:hypothetical protein